MVENLGCKISVFGIIYLVSDMATDTKREISLNTFGMQFPIYIFLELFCLILILKCGGLHILVSDRRAAKARRALIHLVKTELMHIG